MFLISCDHQIRNNIMFNILNCLLNDNIDETRKIGAYYAPDINRKLYVL